MDATPTPQSPSHEGFPHVAKCILGRGHEPHAGAMVWGVHCTCLFFHLKENTFLFLPKNSELFLLIIRDHSSPFLTPVTVVGKK